MYSYICICTLTLPTEASEDEEKDEFNPSVVWSQVQNVKGGGLSVGPATKPRKNQAAMETTTEEKTNSQEKDDSALLEAKMKEVDESQKEVNSLKNLILSTKTTSKITTWNVRTLFQCGKIDQIIREMENYDLKMLGISKIRWTGSGQLSKGGKTILYSGHSHMHTHGVGIKLSKEAQRALIGWQPVKPSHHNQI